MRNYELRGTNDELRITNYELRLVPGTRDYTLTGMILKYNNQK